MINFEMTPNFVKHEEDSQFAPLPKGQYRCELSGAQIIEKSNQDNTAKRVEFTCIANAFAPDNSTRKVFIRLWLDHSSTGAAWRVKKEQNYLFELYTNVLKTKYFGDNSQFPSLTPQSIHLMNGALVDLGIEVDPENSKFNTIVEFHPLSSQPAAQQPMQQQVAMGQPVQPQYQQPVQQQAPAIQQAQNNIAPQQPVNTAPNSAMPPFMQQQ